MILHAAFHAYMKHGFKRLAFNTRRSYLHGFISLQRLWTYDLKDIKRTDVLDLLDDIADMPGKAKMALAALNAVYNFHIDRGGAEHNPASKIKVEASKPIPRWEESEIDLFLSLAPDHLRRAVLLAYYTGQRISDIVRMQEKDYDGNTIKVTQKKTSKKLIIPVHRKLREALDTRPSGPYLISNFHGNPWNTGSLQKAISIFNRQIGLVDRSVHGLRKSCAAMLAERGCTPHQIMAITGHQTLKEVTRYTVEAEQKRLAEAAMEKWS